MCLTPVKIPIYDSLGTLQSVSSVPCGKCRECLAERRRHWTHRLYYENFFSLSSFFLTLTYDDQHVPLDGVSKRDCQLFLKRFRKFMPKLRYFLVSEYGDTFGRPHYHALVFFPKASVSLVDCVRAVEKSWQQGFIKVGDVTIQSIQYCSKYCLKDKVDFEGFVDPESGEWIERQRTFALMSRRPGIGSQLLSWPEWVKNHTFGEGNFKDVVFDKTVSLPRYFRDKIFTDIQKNNHNARIAEKYRKNRVQTSGRTIRGNEFLQAVNQVPGRSSKIYLRPIQGSERGDS